MELDRLLPVKSIALRVQAADRAAAIHALAERLDSAKVRDVRALEQELLKRERIAPTDMGHGIAIPHAKTNAVTEPVMAAITLADPLPGDENDPPVRLLFLIAVPEQAADTHVCILASLATRLREPGLCDRLLAADTPQAFFELLQAPEQREESAPPPATYRVLAVTACPTGIAHTFLAKAALLEEAERMGIAIKVEANGAIGIEDPLTPEEIRAAECIIIAADRVVETARFAGKPLFRVPVGEAVRHPEQLLHRALSATAPDFVPSMTGLFNRNIALTKRLKYFLHRLYTHLMSGISRMLPFVTGGGILIALSYLLAGVGGNELLAFSDRLPRMLNAVGQASFALMYAVLAGFIASSLGDVPAFVPGAVGGYLAWSGMTTGLESTWVSSGFWGALIAGFGAGLLLRLLKWLGKRLPKYFDQIKVTLFYPAFGLLAIAILMIYIVNPPLGRFNDWIYAGLTSLHGGSRLVLCAVLGGLMATDYGGPINKAAYLFGTVALMNQQYDIMAAVMVGGMSPPIGIALACFVVPDRFTSAGKRTAFTNMLLGASFVTEGALPFAMRDPLRVIPSCFAGSAVAGLMTQAMGCGVPAPHGGLFLLPVMTKPIGFLIALGVGSAVTTLLLALLKRPLSDQAANIPVPIIVRKTIR